VPRTPADGELVPAGSLRAPSARVTLDVLLPGDADIPSALAHARAEVEAAGFALVDELPEHPPKPMVTVRLASFDDLGWAGKKPGYVESWVSGTELDRVFSTVAIVRLEARGASRRSYQTMTRLSRACRTIAAARGAWIFDGYRARLHTVESFTEWLPDAADVGTIVRVVAVTSRTKPVHVRTMGFARLGLPELYIPDIVPEPDLQVARYLMFAAAQAYLERGGITRRGRLDIDLTALVRDWDPAERGTGKLELEARWVRGPIRGEPVIELTLPGGSRDPAEFAAALHRFAGPAAGSRRAGARERR
jgi:hypothetical protein